MFAPIVTALRAARQAQTVLSLDTTSQPLFCWCETRNDSRASDTLHQKKIAVLKLLSENSRDTTGGSGKTLGANP